MREPRFWVVSPNVKNNPSTVPEWSQASRDCEAAFMGYGPDDTKHKRIGYNFANLIKSGDYILIARRSHYKPEVVGFGIVDGPFRRSLKGLRVKEKCGSLRKLSPFIPLSTAPPWLHVGALQHTKAMRELRPERSPDERLICESMQREIRNGVRLKRRPASRTAPRTPTVRIGSLRHGDELEYRVRTREAIRRAKKSEDELVRAYEIWLKNQGRELSNVVYGRLCCDAYEEDRRNLIEAKCSAKREYIRMAVGQLLDYAYLGKAFYREPNLAILLPSKPDINLLGWLSELKISVIWRERRKFLDNASRRFT